MDFELAKSRATKHFLENMHKENKKNSFPLNLLNSDLHIKWREDENRIQLKNQRSSSDNFLNISKNQLKKIGCIQSPNNAKKEKLFENPNIYYSLRKIADIDEKTYALRNGKSERNIHINYHEKKQNLIKAEKSKFSPEKKIQMTSKR